MKKKSFLSVKVSGFLLIATLALFLPHNVQAETIYGISGGEGRDDMGYSNPGSYMIVDQTTAAATILGTPYGGIGLSGLATNSAGRMFAVTSVTNPDNTSHLIEIDSLTGTMIKDIGPMYDANGNGCAIGDLSFQPGTDVLFGIAGNQSSVGTRCGVQGGGSSGGYLLTINTTTAQYTIIGRDPSLGNCNGGLAFAPNGTLYFTPCWNNTGNIHTLNPTNGNILTSQALQSGDCYMGLGVRPSDGKIFGSYRYKSSDTGIYTINPTTGAEMLVGNPGNIMVGDLTFSFAQAFETWTGAFSFSIKITSQETDNSGNEKFLTSNQTFTGTISLFIGDNGLTKSTDGCYLQFLGDDGTSICIKEIAGISTESQKSKSEKALLVGSGKFTTTIEGTPVTGNVYIDAKATLKQDSTNELISIGLSGKVGGGVDSDFVFSGTMNNTTLTKQAGTSF
jgi:hypothetical protein